MARHNPPELWFRGGCRPEIIAGAITRTARRGARGEDHPRGYATGERVRVRCFDVPGVDEVRRWAIVRSLRVCRFDAFAPSDLVGMPQAERSLTGLATALVQHYREPLHVDTALTIVDFTYDGEATYGDDS